MSHDCTQSDQPETTFSSNSSAVPSGTLADIAIHGEAGGVEHLVGAIRIVGNPVGRQRRFVLPGFERVAQAGRIGRMRVAIHRDFADLLAVERQADRLAHVHVVERSDIGVEVEVHVRAGRREPVVVVLRILGHIDILDIRNEVRLPVDLAVHPCKLHGVIAWKCRKSKAGNGRLAFLPVIGVGVKLEDLGLEAGDLGKWTGCQPAPRW